jgi:hypothetical protein
MAFMKIDRAQLFPCCVVSCVLFAGVNVACADLGGDHIIGDAAHRTVRSSKSKDHFAKGGGLLHVYRSSENEYRTEKPVRRKKKF